jgi:hypothetical protein
VAAPYQDVLLTSLYNPPVDQPLSEARAHEALQQSIQFACREETMAEPDERGQRFFLLLRRQLPGEIQGAYDHLLPRPSLLHQRQEDEI